VTRHVARNFDGGGGKQQQVSAFDYIMPSVIEASSMNGAFF